MKRGKTRKNTNRYNMHGGVARAYAANAFNVDVLNKLTELTGEINELSVLANTYRSNTEELNSSSAMSAHLNSANSIKQRAQAAYDKAREFWFTVYGQQWVEPVPAPAPSPSV